MKTKEQIEAAIAKLNQELEVVVLAERKAEAEKVPDFLVNFDPFKIREFFKFLEPKDNSEKYLKNPTERQAKWGIDEYSFYDYKEPIQFGDWVVTCVDQQGGGEGSGEHWHCVFKVEKNGEIVGHYYIPGYYQSYNGTDIEWDSIYEVEPYEKTVIDWKRI